MKNITRYLYLIATSLSFSPNVLSEKYNIDVSLPEINHGKYERPYVAVWLAGEKNTPLRVLALWHENPRWIKDLKHYWRRIGRKSLLAVDGISGATRKAGNYQLSWDGSDQAGTPLDIGHYKLCIEVSREHGAHSAKCLSFTKSEADLDISIASDGEFKQLRLRKVSP